MSETKKSAPMFGLSFSCESIEKIADQICDIPVPAGQGPRHLVTLNVDHVVHLRKHAEFRQAYVSAWKATIDGMPVLLYARVRKIGVKSRVTGADLFAVVFRRLQAGRHRPFLVAANHRTATILSDELICKGFDPTQFVVHIPDFGFEKDAVKSGCLVDEITRLKPTHIFFGVGAPKSEIWIDRHRSSLGDSYCLCVGAALDFHAGTAIRAPKWMRRTGFEWAWRFAQQPTRMFRRYFVDSRYLIGAILTDIRNNGRRLPSMKAGAWV